MKASWQQKVSIIQQLLKGKLVLKNASLKLRVTGKTVRNYRQSFLKAGPEGLRDHRHSNYRKLTANQKQQIREMKQQGPWRSARFIRDHLKLPVHHYTVQREIVKAGLSHENPDRLKPITRFVAPYPNDLWQTDIMGRMIFSRLGVAYLIGTLDDHSRAFLSSKWGSQAV